MQKVTSKRAFELCADNPFKIVGCDVWSAGPERKAISAEIVFDPPIGVEGWCDKIVAPFNARSYKRLARLETCQSVEWWSVDWSPPRTTALTGEQR